PATKNDDMIRNTKLSMNGELPRIAPVSGLRSGPLSGTVSQSISATNNAVATPANHSPRVSSLLSPSDSAGGASPSYLPRRGSTIFDEMSVQTTISTMLDAMPK